MSLQDTYQSRKNLLASNLTSMGVTASGTEGLTTLIDKILDIGATLTLTTDKSIVSYYDSETATLTATHSGGAGKTVEVYNAITGSKIGDATDNQDGTYTYIYNSAGVGDISMTAVSGQTESNSISIEDCKYYADATKVNSWSTSSVSGGLDYKSAYNLSDGETAYFKLATMPNWFVIGLYDGNSYFQLQRLENTNTARVYTNGVSPSDYSHTFSDNDVIKFEIVSSTEQKVYINDTLLHTASNHSFSNPKPMIRKYNTVPYNMDYVKVK